VFNWFRRKPRTKRSETYAALRMRALSVKPADVGLATSTEPSTVVGLLMEFWATRATVSLVALVDGSTSLYFSNGGGLIGNGAHPAVAEATAHLVALAQQYKSQIQQTTSFPTPTPGRVRFFLMTSTGVLTAETDEDSLLQGADRFSALFLQGQHVMEEVFKASENPAQVADATSKRPQSAETSGTMGFLDLAFQGKSTPIAYVQAEVEHVFPAIQESSREFMDCFGPQFSNTPNGHIETDVAGAASIAGSIVLRATGIDLHQYPPGSLVPVDVEPGAGRHASVHGGRWHGWWAGIAEEVESAAFCRAYPTVQNGRDDWKTSGALRKNLPAFKFTCVVLRPHCGRCGDAFGPSGKPAENLERGFGNRHSIPVRRQELQNGTTTASLTAADSCPVTFPEPIETGHGIAAAAGAKGSLNKGRVLHARQRDMIKIAACTRNS
jgi:hypothetical protein